MEDLKLKPPHSGLEKRLIAAYRVFSYKGHRIGPSTSKRLQPRIARLRIVVAIIPD